MRQPNYTPPPGYSPKPPKRCGRTGYSTWTVLAAAASSALFGALAAATLPDDSPNPAACKAAIKVLIDRALTTGDNVAEGTRPHACHTFDDKTLTHYATEILQKEQLNK